MKRLLFILLTVLLANMLSEPAQAQAAVPVGFWVTADGGERLLVQSNAQCSFAATGAAAWGGSCTWDSTSRGGILSVWYGTIAGPAAVRWSVVWVDQSTITVNGDVFHRQQ